MSFTIGRTYVLAAGRDYSGTKNPAIKFTATVAIGSTALQFGQSFGPNPFERLSEILGTTGGTPAVSGPGFDQAVGITGTTGSNFITTGATSQMAGTYEYYLFDSSVPSSLDSPVLAIHVLGTAGNFSFNSLTKQSITLPAGSLVAGGIYDYGIGEISALGNTGSLLGLAPAIKPFIV